MHTHANAENGELWDKLSSLKTAIDEKRKAVLQKRIKKEPHITDLEYLLGAFMEMYEPHLKQFVHKLSEKGYAIDPSSGFGGNNAEYQSIVGYLSIDYVIKNKLEKFGVKFREYNGLKSLTFWPEEASLAHITKKWKEITDMLPDKGVLATPSDSYQAIIFRRKYVPKDQNLQKQRLFERLHFHILKKVENETKKRRENNPHPSRLESSLGIFIEELEPQVRKAIIKMNKKGYSTDKSGFMSNPSIQMVEGDFQLDDDTISKLGKAGAIVETNSSGYTIVQFSPAMPDIQKIKKMWDKIVSILPDKKKSAAPSMTRHSREFRAAY